MDFDDDYPYSEYSSNASKSKSKDKLKKSRSKSKTKGGGEETPKHHRQKTHHDDKQTIDIDKEPSPPQVGPPSSEKTNRQLPAEPPPSANMNRQSPATSDVEFRRRLSSVVDMPNEDLGASLWKRGKRTLDIEFRFTNNDSSTGPLLCHSLIIVHWSTVLSIMVEKAKARNERNSTGQAIVHISNDNFKRSDFEIMIRYLYFRDVNIDKMTPLRRRRLISLARDYHVPGLERACKRFLQFPLSTNNVYLYLDEALEKKDEPMRRRCLELIRMNRGCFAPDTEYLDITPATMEEIVSLQQLPINEMELFTFFFKWWEATKDGDESLNNQHNSFTFVNNNNNTKEQKAGSRAGEASNNNNGSQCGDNKLIEKIEANNNEIQANDNGDFSTTSSEIKERSS